MESVKVITLDEVGSTNTWLGQNASAMADFTIVQSVSQNAGRGQRGNSWESEPGCNITLSMLYRPVPDFKPADQFAISEATALAVADTLKEFGIKAKVKWPNDIYVGDSKISGILIEHSLMGNSITHSVLGIGLNVNQKRFVSDAPNPISMTGVTGQNFDLDNVRDTLAARLTERLATIADPEQRMQLHEEFCRQLWRGDGGMYPFRDTATGEIFSGRIKTVEPRGILCLEPGGRRYAFKEVSFLIF